MCIEPLSGIVMSLFSSLSGKFINSIGASRNDKIFKVRQKIGSLLSSFDNDLEEFKKQKQNLIGRGAMYTSMMETAESNIIITKGFINELISLRDKASSKLKNKELDAIIKRLCDIEDQFNKH